MTKAEEGREGVGLALITGKTVAVLRVGTNTDPHRGCVSAGDTDEGDRQVPSIVALTFQWEVGLR